MQKTVLFGVLACFGMAFLSGCGSPSSQTSTPKEKEGFAGSAMPEDAKKQFQQTQQSNQQNFADIAAKAKAAAGH
jgi:uncharacterized membrane protein